MEVTSSPLPIPTLAGTEQKACWRTFKERLKLNMDDDENAGSPARSNRSQNSNESDGGHPYDSICGPFYTASGLAHVLGVADAIVNDRVEAGSVLAARSAEGELLFPTWQLTNDRVDPTLAKLWKLLRQSGDDWSCLLWMRAPSRDLEGLSPMQWIRDGRDPHPVLEASSRVVAKWAQ